jgi:hypothetical protein
VHIMGYKDNLKENKWMDGKYMDGWMMDGWISG